MKQSIKNIPSRDDINTAVSRFLEIGGQIERLGSVKPGYVTEMLDEHGWNNVLKLRLIFPSRMFHVTILG